MELNSLGENGGWDGRKSIYWGARADLVAMSASSSPILHDSETRILVVFDRLIT